jgi:bacillithiol synthase
MIKTILPFDAVTQLAPNDLAYAREEESLAPFYKYAPSQISFQRIIEDKSKGQVPRTDLVEVLHSQYQNLEMHPEVSNNIAALLENDTYTVVTAHQPSLFLGPFYFAYKIINTINLASAVAGMASPKQTIVPVFVIGAEDHDFDELNHMTIFGKKVVWQSSEKGPIGSMSTASIRAEALEQLRNIIGDSEHGRTIMQQFDKAYDGKKTVSQAVQCILNDLFGKYGLVVLDTNDKRLKQHFIPVMRQELTEQVSHKLVTKTIDELNKLGYKTQAAPREINLFYLSPQSRERIVYEDGVYRILNTEKQFTKAEILAELEQFPERFSPNVVLRPLFQEMILPNLAYVGGGGELAYWMERKTLFEHFQINFPLLVRRNSVLWIDRDLSNRLEKLDITPTQAFEDVDKLIKTFINKQATDEINLNVEKKKLAEIFDAITYKAERIDPTLKGAIEAEAIKQQKALEQLQSRIERAEKQKHEASIQQIRNIKERLFPGNSLQERTDSFLPYYLRIGERYFDILIHSLKPLEKGFVVLIDN